MRNVPAPASPVISNANPTHTGHGASVGDGGDGGGDGGEGRGKGRGRARGASRGTRAGTAGGGARSAVARKRSGST